MCRHRPGVTQQPWRRRRRLRQGDAGNAAPRSPGQAWAFTRPPRRTPLTPGRQLIWGTEPGTRRRPLFDGDLRHYPWHRWLAAWPRLRQPGRGDRRRKIVPRHQSCGRVRSPSVGPLLASAFRDRAACAARERSFSVVQMNAQPKVPSDYRPGPRPQTRAPAS